jgi:hypothetical protein
MNLAAVQKRIKDFFPRCFYTGVQAVLSLALNVERMLGCFSGVDVSKTGRQNLGCVIHDWGLRLR